jgi:hypothetical protein
LNIRVTVYNFSDVFVRGGRLHMLLQVFVQGLNVCLGNKMSSDAPLNKLFSLQSVPCKTKVKTMLNVMFHSCEEV